MSDTDIDLALELIGCRLTALEEVLADPGSHAVQVAKRAWRVSQLEDRVASVERRVKALVDHVDDQPQPQPRVELSPEERLEAMREEREDRVRR